MNPVKTALIGIGIAVLAGACVTTTNPLTDEERAQRVADDVNRMFSHQEPVGGAITLAEAKARAIKYNMDYRIKAMEYALSSRNLDIAKVELLPQLAASAGYSNRSNQPGASSRSLLTGEESLEPSTSQERASHLRDLTIAWNVLDFGVSYVTAKQRQNELHIIEEHRRKAIQNIIQEVTEAYWNGWSAQVLLEETQGLMLETKRAVEKSRTLMKTGVQRKRDSLIYQRRMLEIRAELWDLREKMLLARTRLSKLMNLPPGTAYDLASPEAAEPATFSVSVDELEQTALAARPELREEDYKQRINRLEVKKSLLRMFPGIEINAGTHYDSNQFLFNPRWSDVGLRVSWNLFGIFHTQATKKFQNANIALADTRRMALSMAVLTQVRLALQRYELARTRYDTAAELAKVNQMYSNMTVSDQQTQTGFDIIQARMTALTSTMRKHLAYAEVQNAMTRVFNSIGADPLPRETTDSEIQTLARVIERHSKHLVMTHLTPRREIPAPATGPRLDLLVRASIPSRKKPAAALMAYSAAPRLDLVARAGLPAPADPKPEPFNETVVTRSEPPRLEPVDEPLVTRSDRPEPLAEPVIPRSDGPRSKPLEKPMLARNDRPEPLTKPVIPRGDRPRWTYYENNKLVAVEDPVKEMLAAQ